MKTKQNIYLMYAISLLQGMVFYGSIATLYRQVAGVTIFQITIIESISLALCLLLEMPWGVIADKIGYKKTMFFCCSLYFVSKIVFWKASGFTGFLLERIMLSIVISGLSGVDSSILYLSCKIEDAQKIFGIYNVLQTLGLLFASTIYSIFVGDNYRVSALLTVLSYGLAAILALFLKEVHNSKKQEEQNTSKKFVSILRQTIDNKHLILFLIAVALFNETHQTITVFLNQLQYVKCGLSNSAVGYIYIVVTVIGLFGAFSSKLTRKLGIQRFSRVLFLIAISACSILTISNNSWLSILSIALLRFVFSLFQPLQMDLQNKQIVSRNRATALSVNATLINCVGIASNLIFGKLAEVNLKFAFAAGVVFCTLGLIIFSLWMKYYKSNIAV